MDCTDKRERIVIIFYRIKPSVVRDLEGSFQKAFVYHEERKRFKEMQKWRSALATACSLPCWETEKSKDNAKLIENICMRIYENLIKIRSKTIQST